MPYLRAFRRFSLFLKPLIVPKVYHIERKFIMRTKEIMRTVQNHVEYGAGSGNVERLEFECPCGKGKIIEEHDNIPGFRDHDVYIDCDLCNQKYYVDKSKGVKNWELVEKYVQWK